MRRLLESLPYFAGFLTLIGACNGAGNDPAAPTDTRPLQFAATPLRFEDPSIGCRFALAGRDLRTRINHFDPTSPPHKIKHAIELDGIGGPLLRVDVWTRSDAEPLQTWFDQHLAFSVNAGATVEHRLVGKAGVEAIVVNQIRTPQSPARQIVTFALGQQIYRSTCYDREDPTSMLVLQTVLASFESEVQR